MRGRQTDVYLCLSNDIIVPVFEAMITLMLSHFFI